MARFLRTLGISLSIGQRLLDGQPGYTPAAVRRLGVLAISVMLAAALACGGASAPGDVSSPAPKATATAAQTITLADVSDSPSETIMSFQPLADYLASQLADFGIEQGKVIVAPDLETIAADLESGTVDLYFDSPFPALDVVDEVGAFVLVRRWKGGVAEYHTKIVVPADSGITDLDGLKGALIAFDDSVSTSGYLLPKSHLVGLGYILVEQPSAGSSVAAGEIGYVFAGGEENVLAWVLEGKAPAGVLASGDYDALSEDLKRSLRVIETTVAVPRHIALSSPTMDAALRERVTELLLHIHETAEGRAALEAFESTTRFDALPAGPEETLASLRELFAAVR